MRAESELGPTLMASPPDLDSAGQSLELGDGLAALPVEENTWGQNDTDTRPSTPHDLSESEDDAAPLEGWDAWNSRISELLSTAESLCQAQYDDPLDEGDRIQEEEELEESKHAHT
ncbi:hypothetical protein QFC20_006624 [Naganishia adeliensis]|uniref:Uncharacterized protein n=1 Tax=Naganishia adeliensis TaxID=92952 RepID=A0ACC2V9C6_9TREE|nr:hypothetical protein QFC20_006624 [Naganishia adeliensis]